MIKSIFIFSIFLSIFIIPVYPHSLQAEEKQKITILGLEARQIEQGIADTISDTIAVELSNIGDFEVITKADMKAMLDLESQKQLMGCEDDVSCIAEIGGALGVDKIIAGSLGKIGQTYILNLSLVNVLQAKVENRVSGRVKGELDQLIDALSPMVAELFGKKAVVRPRREFDKEEYGPTVGLTAWEVLGMTKEDYLKFVKERKSIALASGIYLLLEIITSAVTIERYIYWTDYYRSHNLDATYRDDKVFIYFFSLFLVHSVNFFDSGICTHLYNKSLRQKYQIPEKTSHNDLYKPTLSLSYHPSTETPMLMVGWRFY